MFWGENAAEAFVRDLQQEAKQLFDDYISTPKPMLLTATELRSFNNATTCHAQNRLALGSYRGAAHNECNLMYVISKSGWKLPAIIKNLKGYDGHLIVKTLKSASDSTEHGVVSLSDCGSIEIYRLFRIHS